MAHRYFEGAKHAMLYAKYRPIPPVPLIERVVNFVQEKYSGPLNTAVDVGCGSGQSTGFYSKHFKNVIGTDISKAQIGEATEANTFKNVSFVTSCAETINVPDGSIQLVTACQAAHWFNLPEFYTEVHRALCKGGVLSLYGYEFPAFVTGDEEKDKLLKQCLQNLYRVDLNQSIGSQEVYVGKYRDERYQYGIKNNTTKDRSNSNSLESENILWRKYVDEKYKDKVFNFGRSDDSIERKYTPFQDFTREEEFYEDQDSNVQDIINYGYTWSGFQEYVKKNGQEKGDELLKNFQNKLMEIMGSSPNTDPSTVKFVKRTKFFLLLGRKG